MGCLFKKFQFALPRGERRQRLRQGQHRCPRFNSRSRVGSDGYLAFMPLYLLMFQFALPRGERRFRQIRRRHDCRFNSRSRVGSDRRSQTFTSGALCFNSRSRVGSDAQRTSSCTATAGFQFALPRGERRGWCSFFSLPRRFNSRSRVGSDRHPSHRQALTPVSIRAPAWGATQV